MKRNGLKITPKLDKNYIYFLFCLSLPIFTGVFRKIIPGQPSFIEALAIIPITFIIFNIKILKKRWPSSFIPVLLLSWILVQLYFVVVSLFYDWRVGAISILTRIVPVFLAWISYYSIRSEKSFISLSKTLTTLPLLLFPFGVLAALFGNSALPGWLKPIETIIETGRDFRSGIPSISLVFTSQWILSISILAILFLGLANLLLAYKSKRNTMWWWITSICAISLIYLSTRRGMFIAGIIGIATVLLVIGLSHRKGVFQVVFYSAIFLSILLYIDQRGLVLGQKTQNRTEWVLNENEISIEARMNDVFLPTVNEWITKTPFGNYLGYAGPEARGLGNFSYQIYSSVVEVGAALLVAEMGLFGFVLMPVTNFVVVLIIAVKAIRSYYRMPIFILLLFQVIYFTLFFTKELLDLANVSVGQFFYWAVPGICCALLNIGRQKGLQIRTESWQKSG